MSCGEFLAAWNARLSVDLLRPCLPQAVFTKHVNLVDYVEGSRENIQIFESEEELSKYTLNTGKIFPKEDAADGGVLRALRRHILAPCPSHFRRGISRKFK